MTRRKKSDGERIAGTAWVAGLAGFTSQYREKLASDIDRLVRRRMAEAWDLGRTYGINNIASDANPYRGRGKP